MAISPQLPRQRLRSIPNRFRPKRSRSNCAWRGLFTLGAKGTQMTPSGRHQAPGRFYQTSVCALDCKARVGDLGSTWPWL
jgi:hypothetical protein